MSPHDEQRLLEAGSKITRGEREIVRQFSLRFPNDPLVLALAADRQALADLKESLAKKSRCNEFAMPGVNG